MSYGRRFTPLLLCTLALFSTIDVIAEQSCSSVSECERYNNNAICSPHGCHGNICQCKPGYSMYPPSTDCVKASLIGEPCNMNTNCRPRNSICNTTTTACQCHLGYKPTSDNFRCFLNTYQQMGEVCNAGDKCTYKTECLNGRCMCKPGYKPWDAINQWYGIPLSLVMECTNQNHTLEDIAQWRLNTINSARVHGGNDNSRDSSASNKCNGSTIVPVCNPIVIQDQTRVIQEQDRLIEQQDRIIKQQDRLIQETKSCNPITT